MPNGSRGFKTNPLWALLLVALAELVVFLSTSCNIVAGPDALGEFTLALDAGDAGPIDSAVPPGDSTLRDSGTVDSTPRDTGTVDSVADTAVRDSALESGEADVPEGCVPKTCAELGTASNGGVGTACGTQNDGCGHAIECTADGGGSVCTTGTQCLNGSCSCVGKTCPELGANCGNQADGCGNFLNCGMCGAGTVCVTNPNGSSMCGCEPLTCAQQGFDCGTAPNGCGGLLNCGTCEAGSFCGGSSSDGGPGMQNVCGSVACVPKAICPAGLNCGTVSDGCGGVLSCGNCPPGETCGGGASADGGATPNVCGCTPQTCAQQGKNCGSSSDGCGNPLSCGTCTAPQSCMSGTCGCMPATCNSLGATCGNPLDGCGGTLSCGSCNAPMVCDSNHQCAATCNPSTCLSLGAQCGTPPNGCGGTLSCGTCTGVQSSCNPNNQCVCNPSCNGANSACGGPNGCGSNCPVTCIGCCSGGTGGACIASMNFACGLGGVTCATCMGSNTCVNGVCTCTPNCTTASGLCGGSNGCGGQCPVMCTGCCQGGLGGICNPTSSDTACGNLGSTCLDCMTMLPATSCVNGMCGSGSGEGTGSGCGMKASQPCCSGMCDPSVPLCCSANFCTSGTGSGSIGGGMCCPFLIDGGQACGS